jgi:hypothetical protein
MSKVYSAVLSNKNTLSVFDAEKGIVSFKINLGDVEVVNGPIVTKDKLTVVVKTRQGTMQGKVYTLPRGILSYSFQVK